MSSSTFTLEGNIDISGYYDFTHSYIDITNLTSLPSPSQTGLTPYARCADNEFLKFNGDQKTIDVIQGETRSIELTFTVVHNCTHVNPLYSHPQK